jgi:glycosyltransferase involved in cell wall biosynthesis
MHGQAPGLRGSANRLRLQQFVCLDTPSTAHVTPPHFESQPAAPALVSVVVLSYNYAHFVAQAIESALAQTWANVEVIVVDNGSTDDSPAVMARYADRARIVRQPVNIGQGQGYNLGFEAARGEWLLWLDADDLLDADAIARCMALVADDTAKVQFPLRLVDAQARPLGGMVPYLRHAGDVVPLIRRFGHYAGPPGSGNLYRRSAVAPYFPVSPAEWPICTDTVPFITAPFHGRVVDTDVPLGAYRLHGNAAATPGYTGNFKVTMAGEVRLNHQARDRALALLASRSGIHVGGPFLTIPTHVRHRIISWRFLKAQHPFPQDDAVSLRREMRDALRECPGYGAAERVLLQAWTLGVLHLPLPLARCLAAHAKATPLLDLVMRARRRPVAATTKNLTA